MDVLAQSVPLEGAVAVAGGATLLVFAGLRILLSERFDRDVAGELQPVITNERARADRAEQRADRAEDLLDTARARADRLQDELDTALDLLRQAGVPPPPPSPPEQP